MVALKSRNDVFFVVLNLRFYLRKIYVFFIRFDTQVSIVFHISKFEILIINKIQ